MNIRILLISCLIVMIPRGICAQDDLLKELEGLESEKADYTIATFKGTRLINLHTVETLHKGSLDFRISHRFGDINSGGKNLWGLDGPAVLRLGLDYSLTDRLTIGVDRTSYKKIADGFVKYKILRQVKGGMPVTLTGLASMNITTEDDATRAITGVDKYEYFTSRMAYMYQAMVARKFSPAISLQISPAFIHYNLVTHANDKNDMLAVRHPAVLNSAAAWRLRLNIFTALPIMRLKRTVIIISSVSGSTLKPVATYSNCFSPTGAQSTKLS